MPCYRPLQAWQRGAAKPVFSCPSGSGYRRIEVPCNQCVGCRLDYSLEWATRCVHESLMHAESCSLTLTYSDEKMPPAGWLRHRDFQLFMKRLRERVARDAGKDERAQRGVSPRSPLIRYFMAGEYGETYSRPHYHAIVFGFSPKDRVFYRNSEAGFRVYTSRLLDELWQNGAVYVGDMSFEFAAYIARYILKVNKADGPHFREIVDVESGEVHKRPHEYCKASLKPGIGAGFVSRFFSDVYPRDEVVLRGRCVAVPRYYDRLLERVSPVYLAELKAKRRDAMDKRMEQLTVEFPELRYRDVRRLDVEEKVKISRIRSLKRSFKS